VLPPTALFQYGKITGFAGCNRYTGPLQESKPGSIRFGELVATGKACDPGASELERQFLARLGRAEAYTFQAGRLLVSGPSDTGAVPGTLVFSR
jgi:heat shock protein HslJ